MTLKQISELEKHEIIEYLYSIKNQLDKKRTELVKTKIKLSSTRKKLEKMKENVQYQRNRIIELYRNNAEHNSSIP